MGIVRFIIEDEEGNPIYNPEVKMISVLKKIIEKDKGKASEDGIIEKGDADGRKKIRATKELAYIYFFIDPRSSYVDDYRDEKKRTEKIKALLDFNEEWKPDKYVLDVIEWYKNEISEDFDLQLLDAGISSLEKTKNYLNEVDYSLTVKGVPIYDPVKIMKINKEIGGVLTELRNTREKAFKSTLLNPKLRGGGELGRFEDPDRKRK